MQVSTRDLRLRTRELMAATARGEKIVITIVVRRVLSCLLGRVLPRRGSNATTEPRARVAIRPMGYGEMIEQCFLPKNMP